MKRLSKIINQNNELLFLILLSFYMIAAPFSVSSIVQSIMPFPTSVFLTFVTGGGILLLYLNQKYLLNSPFYKLTKESFWFIAAFFIPAVFSILAALYNAQVILSNEYIKYLTESMPNRLINMLLFLILIFSILKMIKKISDETLVRIVKAYLIGVGIIMFIGLWQFLHFLIGYPMPELATRAFVHSVDSDVLIDFRLTSILDEPSYLVPFLIDVMIIGLAFMSTYFRYAWKILLPSIFLLVFSFSVSGYANLLIVLGVALLLLLTTRYFNRKKIIFSLILLAVPILIISLLNINLALNFFGPILGRLDTIFDIEQHSRLYMLVMPIIWLFDYSFINVLFGFGPGSYEFLSYTKFLHHQGSLSVTSNNIFIDLLFEHGILGFLFLVSMFIYIAIRLFKKREKHSYYFFGLVLWIHLIVTSLYRSDFVAPRFWAIVIIVFILIELAERSLEYKSKNSTSKREEAKR